MAIDFPKEEEAFLKRWKEFGAFERQVELSRGRTPYTFYDGPPFATGLPHYGHLLASTIKDIIPRYWSMKGRYVERRFGWDTHGVPIEYEIDKTLGMSGSEAVEKLGLGKYNAECRAVVMRFAAEWRQTIDRLGRWIDFDNDYKRLKNYPDPTLIMDRYGSDPLRLYLINSPVVRAEPLRFKESGVKEIVAKVLLPLWNSYKFFEAQVALLKKIEDVEYVFDPAAEATNTNVMDRWILASCQSLLKFVNQEMAGYRLYTVVPRLLGLIDNTTNWYIRFNRRRLKGELGRSVHFLAFPEVREELFDDVIERQVGRMQKVIELGRIARERRSIGLKSPLKTLVVIHQEKQYLDDVRSLEGYILEELNIRDLVLSSDEDKYNVQYSVTADWPTLGKKLKKDAQRVKKALPSLSSNDVKRFVTDKKMVVDGIELVDGDLVIRRGLKDDASSKDFETNTDDDVLIILDAVLYPELAEEGLAREIVNRVQRLRKKAGLVPTDDVGMEYRVLSDPDNVGIERVFQTQSKAIEKALRRPIDQHIVTEVEGRAPEGEEEGIILEEEQEVQKATFLLRLVKL
ncbi:isoleucyl-tRNA synthetase,cytoplasmic [Histoplasma capsulatum H143]|uniref:Isoleucyl-tRNA synthetase,cytoplasmic n=1 Tax=Ajellomyces capsulatus (strain H143) TaxID=544712 RepID=C6HCG4_AJECH|nr:isoleucyl-tRNA synthetase,cytoplasmic [Histoplasma capsulatum H143]